jgi:hypothetical protein
MQLKLNMAKAAQVKKRRAMLPMVGIYNEIGNSHGSRQLRLSTEEKGRAREYEKG